MRKLNDKFLTCSDDARVVRDRNFSAFTFNGFERLETFVWIELFTVVIQELHVVPEDTELPPVDA